MNHTIRLDQENVLSCTSFPVIEDTDEIAESYSDYLQDESRFHGEADRIVFPQSESDVVAIVRSAVSESRSLTVSSARTGISGGGVPCGGTLVSLERMDQILDIRWESETECFVMKCQPGLSLERLERMLTGDEPPKCNEDLMKSDFWSVSRNWFYPPDPTEKTAQLGGTAATNASGSRSFHFGPTRNFIRGLSIVLSNGNVLRLKRGCVILHAGDSVHIQGSGGTLHWTLPAFRMPSVKHAAGYYLTSPMDLIDLFIGSEGTLGIITDIEIMLRPRPESRLGLLLFFKTDAASLCFVRSIKNETIKGIDPTAIEYFDKNALQLLQQVRSAAPNSTIPAFPEQAGAAIYVEQDASENEADAYMLAYDELLNRWESEIMDTWAGTEPRELEAMFLFRHAVPEAVNAKIGQLQRQVPGLVKIGTDLAVPDQEFSGMMEVYRNTLENANIEYAIFGHIGDNHVHVNMIPKDAKELDLAKKYYIDFAQHTVKRGGTVSAEHGIGKIKTHLLQLLYSEEEMQKLKDVKSSFDPNGLFCPGNMVESG